MSKKVGLYNQITDVLKDYEANNPASQRGMGETKLYNMLVKVQKHMEATMIKTICYDEVMLWETREDAIKFFAERIMGSEGSERDRYSAILCKLLCGDTIAIDE